MAGPYNFGSGEQGFVELAEVRGIAATEDASHGVVMFQFFDRGVALLLTESEVLALGRVMETAVAHMKRRGEGRDVTSNARR